MYTIQYNQTLYKIQNNKYPYSQKSKFKSIKKYRIPPNEEKKNMQNDKPQTKKS